VLYKATGNFIASFNKLREQFPQVNWVEEIDFASQLWNIVKNAHDFILWGVDDVLFYNDYDLLESIKILQENTDILSASLRLYPNITYCHPADANSQVPPLTPIFSKGQSDSSNIVLKFNRFEGTQDWNYPFELCATILRKDDVVSILEMIEQLYGREGISHPNKLEVCGSRLFLQKKHPMHTLKYCSCLSNPILSVITINRVQDICPNPIFSSVELETLDKYFWEGKEFDLQYYKDNATKFNAIHIGDFKLIEK